MRECPNGAYFKNISDMKRADIMKERTMSNNSKSKMIAELNAKLKPAKEENSKIQQQVKHLTKWSHESLYGTTFIVKSFRCSPR